MSADSDTDADVDTHQRLGDWHREVRTSGMRPSRGRHTALAHTPYPSLRRPPTRPCAGAGTLRCDPNGETEASFVSI